MGKQAKQTYDGKSTECEDHRNDKTGIAEIVNQLPLGKSYSNDIHGCVYIRSMVLKDGRISQRTEVAYKY